MDAQRGKILTAHVHVAAPTPEDLRDFVLDNLTGRPGVVHAETSLVFHVNRGTNVLSEH